MDVYLNGKRLRLTPSQSIGKGGEADVFDIGRGLAAKIFKSPSHPDIHGQSEEQQAARERIAEHQRKLPAFPRNLPGRVIVPRNLITDRTGKKIVGYAMPLVQNAEVLLRYGNRSFREAGIPNETVGKIFLDLHETVANIHQVGVIAGDFNDLNVLVRDTAAFIIDADSFQFKPFFSRLFTAKFVDPLLCDPQQTSLALIKPHTELSDWYAFVVMLMQSLLFVHPYGGVYRPKDKKKLIPHDARPLKRISVFHPDVRYPKPATPYGVLPDDLLQHFHQVFLKDLRDVFPRRLIEGLRWTKCTGCGTEHARRVCPTCAAPGAIKEVTRIRGKVTATRIFRTSGVILFAVVENGTLKWLYHENGGFKREDKNLVTRGPLDPHIRFRICGDKTLLGKDGQLITLEPDKEPDRLSVDSYLRLPIFDANQNNRYWAASGQLWRDGMLGPELIGDVLQGQTLFWVGPEFGFGFYRAGNLSMAFVFDAEHRGINDTVKLAPIRGQVVDAACVFGKNRAWFFLATRVRGKTINHCTVIRRDGSIEASAEAKEGDDSWLSSIRGKCAAGNFLLTATDDGIIRVEADGNRLVKSREFPDTEPFVNEGCELHAGKGGLYVVDRQEIRILKIA